MENVNFIAFCVGGIAGFFGYLALSPTISASEPARFTSNSWRSTLVVVLALLILVTLLISISAFSVSYTHPVYVFARVFEDIVPRQLLLGIFFGLVLGVWTSYMTGKPSLHLQSHRIAHRRWGLALLTLFLTAIFVDPIVRVLTKITHVTTPIAGFSLQSALPDQSSSGWNSPLYLQGGQDHVSNRNASRDAVSILENLHRRIEADRGFADLLGVDFREFPDVGVWDGDGSSGMKWKIALVAECFADYLENDAGDEAVINAKLREFWDTGAPMLRAALMTKHYEESARHLNDMMAGITTYCPNIYREGVYNEKFVLEGRNLPYLAIVTAHLYQSAGYSREGAKILALWIDRAQSGRNHSDAVEGRYREGIEDISEIFLTRAFSHLYRLLDVAGNPTAAHAVAYRNVHIIEKLLAASSKEDVRNYSTWDKKCPAGVDEYGRTLVFTLMAQRDELVKHRIRYFDFEGGRKALVDDSILLGYVKFNTEVPTLCYPRKLGIYGEYYRGLFLANHGRFLMASKESRQLQTLGVREDFGRIRTARKLFVDALALLQPFENDEKYGYEHKGVREAMEYLSVGEEASDIRRHLWQIEGILAED